MTTHNLYSAGWPSTWKISGELRAHRQIERLAGRQAADEPLVVELGEPPLLRHPRKGALDHGGKAWIVAAEDQPVRIVGQIFADDLHVVRGGLGGDDAVEQHVVGGEGVGLAGGEHGEGLRRDRAR